MGDDMTQNNDANLYLALLFDLIYQDVSTISKEWAEFANEIKSKSRYFPKGVLLDRIKTPPHFVVKELEKGTILYRARLFETSYEFAKEELKNILEVLKMRFPDEKISEFDLENIDRLAFLYQLGENEDIYQKITALKGNTNFYGYKRNGSDAPKNSSNSGRANSKNISFLYASEEKETAIMEVFPKLGQEVNLAEIELSREIKLFNFFYDMKDIKEGEYAKASDLGILSSLFSRPNYKDEFEYLPTQYLCEYIRELGFDGMRFCSSVKKGGINIVIFDTEAKTKPYIVKNSKVMKVKDIKVEFDQILPSSI